MLWSTTLFRDLGFFFPADGGFQKNKKKAHKTMKKAHRQTKQNNQTKQTKEQNKKGKIKSKFEKKNK